MRVFISLSVLILITVIGCNTSKKTLNMNKANQELTGSYTVLTMHDAAPKTNAPKFSFYAKDNSFQGNTGCNSVFGTYNSEGQNLDLSELAVSEMYCAEEGVMETERTFLDILNNTGSYKITENTLIFYAKEGSEVLLEASIGTTK